ncbi:hypothetical protein [Kocuria sp. NPDC057446]|uniref:hypothetical protein n=1 Tax=Kocuria sp. NPDC057446 TaxID=3346137 RepID=UPI00369A0181
MSLWTVSGDARPGVASSTAAVVALYAGAALELTVWSDPQQTVIDRSSAGSPADRGKGASLSPSLLREQTHESTFTLVTLSL